MAITSKNKNKKLRRYVSTQSRYALTYAIITLVVLVVLNLYCSQIIMRLFYQNKESTMLDKTQLAASELGKLDNMTDSTISEAIERVSSLKSVPLIVTDPEGIVLFSSNSGIERDQQVDFPQITKAMDGYDVFDWEYHAGVMCSQAATPLISDGVISGCVYAMECDTEQGGLIASIQRTILTITVLLELVVIFFSTIFARVFSARLTKIMASMQIMQQGDYSHKVRLSGHDELTVLAEEFNRMTDRLNISESKRRQFVSDASHELKTPLASIKLLADSILQNDMDIATIREFVGDIGDEAERLNRMSEKLLSLTRGEVSTESDTMEIIPMAPTVTRVVSMLSPLAASGNVTIEVNLAEDAHILIREDDLYQITYNLAENGIKYNVPGGKLTISLSRGEDIGILTVSDTGTGIPEDCVSHIFERFYRVDKARSRASGGSGLGLAIVKNMVERNQGSIHAESTFGLGTTFKVEFPAFEIEEESE